jgi:hypothetical protein
MRVYCLHGELLEHELVNVLFLGYEDDAVHAQELFRSMFVSDRCELQSVKRNEIQPRDVEPFNEPHDWDRPTGAEEEDEKRMNFKFATWIDINVRIFVISWVY